jgi:LPS-assembly protein
MRRAVLAGIAILLAANGTAFAASILGKQGDVLLRADEVVYDMNTSIVTARGHVEIDYNSHILDADEVSYNQKTDVVSARGHISMLAPNGDVAFANVATLSDGMRDGALQGFSALIGTNGRMTAAHAVRKGGTVTVATDAAYTHCKVCNKPGQRTPLWQVEAARVTYDQLKHRIYFHDAVVRAFGVPIFFTPYLSEPDPTVKRQSGLLAPEFGHATALGSFVRVPVYISLTDSRDMTIAPTLTTDSGEFVEGEYRERWNHGGMWLQASLADNPSGGLTGNQNQWYSSVFGAGRVQFADTWTAGYDVQLTSNDTYLQRYDITTQDRLNSDLYVEDINGRSRFAITGYFFQGLRATDSPKTIPIVLPLIEFTFIPEHNVLGGEFRLDVNTASITQDIGEDSQRVTTEMNWKLPFVSEAGQLITFEADVRGDIYHVSNANPLNLPGVAGSKFIERGLPYIAADWRWPFVSGGIAQTAFVIEPIAQVILAPYGDNPAGIPNEDSTDFELDETDLFSFQRMPGYDLAETGPRATVGVRSEAIFPSGSVEVLLGQAFRLKPDPVFAADSGIAGKTSDLISRVTIKFPPWFSLTHRVDIDETDGSINRNEVYLDGTFGRSSVEISYVRLPQQAVTQGLVSREEINGQATVGFLDHWLGFAGARRDLQASQMIDTEYGLGYEDECLGVALSYQRKYTRDRDVLPSSTFLLRFNLKTDDTPAKPAELFDRHVFSTP